MPGHRSFKDLESQLHERPGATERIAAHRGAAERELEEPEDERCYPLAEIRRRRGKSVADLAQALGIGVEDVAAIEQGSDNSLSTIRSYLRAVGAELELSARFTDGEWRPSADAAVAPGRVRLILDAGGRTSATGQR